MLRRPVVLAALAAVLVGALVAVLVLRGGEDGPEALGAGEALTLALRAVPADAPLLGLVETDPDAPQVKAAAELAQAVPAASIGLGLVPGQLLGAGAPDLTKVRAQLTHPVVVAQTTTGRVAVTALDDPDATRERLGRPGGASTVAGRLLVAAENERTLRDTLARANRTDDRTSATPRSLAARLDGLDGQEDAIARLAATPEFALPQLGVLGRTRYANRAEQIGVAVTALPRALQLDVHLRHEPLPPVALPLAVGAQPPAPRGVGPLTVSLRNAAQTARWAAGDLRPPQLDELSTALAEGAELDLQGDVLDAFTGTTTLTSPDAQRFTARADVQDLSRIDAGLERLDRLDRLAPLAAFFGVDTGGYDVEQEGDVRTITRDDALVARLLTTDGTFVASNDPDADLPAVASAPPPERLLPAKGALYATADTKTSRALARRLVPALPALGANLLGPTLVTARQEPTGLSATVLLSLGG